jgi:hypothetical protein
MQTSQETEHRNGAARAPSSPQDGAGAEAEARRAEAHELLVSLMRELFQTEESAVSHPRVEAERLGESTPPARAMLAVAAHAEEVLAELPRLARDHDLPVSAGGMAVGKAFSSTRDAFVDMLLTAEKSYRGTILGMRHGVDLVELMRYLAQEESDLEIEAWCSEWLARRRPLVEATARELSWFAANPDRAMEPAKDGAIARAAQAVAQGIEQVAEKLRP